jgi:hypothetical protein
MTAIPPGDSEASITRTELTHVFQNTRLPTAGSSGYRTLPELTGRTPEYLVSSMLNAVVSLRAEADRWVTGALYTDSKAGTPGVYLREVGGWWEYSGGARYADGALDTTRWQRLIPEKDASLGECPRHPGQFGDH